MTPPPPGQLYVVRHGETEWSLTGRHTGRTDLDLTDPGLAEAEHLRAALDSRRFVEIRTSPLRRAARTAEIAGLVPALPDPDLVERDYGAYEGMTTPEIAEVLGRPWSVWTDGVPPGETPGETLAEVAARVDRVLERVRPRLADGDVALVAHAHSLRVLTARWLGLDAAAARLFRLETAAYGVLGFEHERPVIRRWSVRD
ncbi:MAG: histidine phosphatase family protein [Kineosporiaceae bacterium]